MKRNIVILIAVAAAIVAVVWFNQAGNDKSSPAASGGIEAPVSDPSTPKKGSPAPAFTLATLDGKATYEVGGKRDKPVIVNFWASWCGPCDMEAPDLVELYDKYKDKVELYAVNATKYDKVWGAKQFVEEKGFTFPVLTDAKGEAGDAYKVFSYPTSFIVDRNGTIRQRIDGVITLKQWESYLDEITK
ncbi:TlpA family protein disulfide reductase [Cohnella pontilimi]|uniref:TlpA family protein disulfide reductase n=1 Tax=Cohnella pontilimi TaxID=2564100 RepID=A0A4U0F9D9_9BACL|nr:TlpA disulfide reductase family protein [Cohnella pontilimi]TJY41376.1 TlpA family protein disulfide reductase [Cohnella pontilimi]